MKPQRDSYGKLLRAVQIGVLALTSTAVAGFTAVETLTLMPLVVHYSYDRSDAIVQCASYCILIFLWLLCLIAEYAMRYRRRAARALRRGGMLIQALVLAVLISCLVGQKQPQNAVMIALAFLGTAVLWGTYMRTHLLPSEDQKILDALVEEEARLAADAWTKRTEQERERRLQDALARVRRFTVAGLNATKSAHSAPLWNVPSGKHAPMVYFIRNGNRVKIGTTTELRRRIRTLALRPEHVMLLLPGTQTLERALHKRFADLRDGNTEWFQFTGLLTEYVTEQNAKIQAAGGDQA